MLLRIRAWTALALCGLFSAANAASAQILTPYSIRDLGSVSGAGGTSQARAISTDGHYVTGLTSVPGGSNQAFRYDALTNSMTALGTLPGTANSIGLSVNTGGAVAGYSTNGNVTPPVGAIDPSDRAFVNALGLGSLPIPILSGGYTSNRAHGINNGGQVVGYASNAVTDQGYRYTTTTGLTALGFLPPPPGAGGDASLAYHINTGGTVIGSGNVDNATADILAITYAGPNGTSPTPLGRATGFNSSYGTAINDAGHAVGYVDNFGVGPTRGFFFNGTTLTALGVLSSGDESFANGINNLNQVVGDSNTSPGGASHAVIYDVNGVPTDLTGLLTGPGSAGWQLQSAYGISDNGLIVGFGINPQGLVHGFLLTPVPEPTSFALAGVGALGLLRVVRRRRAAKT
jgi:probable HAF family extracellular repeat protein